ncbi:oligosaccharyl transferase glycoprotein complex, beta subunit [Fusarium irregulare]|nr:oligosaccharyl transferase glycoprotein complex, beta subunit [Fusarium irregulare]
MRSLLSLVLFLFAAVVSAVSTAGNRLLVVLDSPDDKKAYTTFFGDLSERGYEITYESPKSESLGLFLHGERTYDHLLFLPTTIKGLGPKMTPQAIIEFINAGGNILVSMSSTHTVPSTLDAVLTELDIHIPAERTAKVVDHFSYDTISASEDHDVLVLEAPPAVRKGMKDYFEIPGAFLSVPRAIGHILGNGQLLTPVLRSPATAYSYHPKEQNKTIEPDELFSSGRQLNLVTVFQARNSARVTVIGAAEMFQDKTFDTKVARQGGQAQFPANREFVTNLAAWTFQELGVLRVNKIEHRLDGSNETNPDGYRVKNDVSYNISLSEYAWNNWQPYHLPEGDKIQLEFSMLSPFWRLNLKPILSNEYETIYGTNFTLPDQHGIFNFMVNYKRSFLTNIEEKKTVSVRHLAHNEYDRSYSINGAWPPLAGIFFTILGFLAFSVVWLYSAKPRDEVAAKKTQ